MDELPSVALVNVLNHLPYRDLMRCLLVNKLWRHLIHRSVIKRDLVLFIENHPHANWWRHSGEEVNLENSVQVNYSVFESEAFFELFKSVKSLFLSFNHLFLRKQDLLDKLSSHFSDTLENLQIDYQFTGSLELDDQLSLALKNLQTFCFSRKTKFTIHPHRQLTLSLDCDRLTHFYANTDLSIESNTLIARIAPNLRVLFASWITYRVTEPLEFPNLECLGCCNAPGAQFLVSCLPSLKKFYFANYFPANLAEARQSIDEFLTEIERKRRKVDVYWAGLKFTLENLDRNLDAFLQIQRFGPEIESKTLNYFKENSSILHFDYLPYTGEPTIIYSDALANQLDENADRELMSNLRIILRTVFLDCEFRWEFDVPKLASLFQNVSKLMIGRGFQKPSQLNALPEIFPNLRTFFWDFTSSECILDFSFISKFKNLFHLCLACLVSLDILDQILTNCKHFYCGGFGQVQERIIFRVGYRHIKTFDSSPENRFDLRVFSVCRLTPIYFKEKEELFEYLDRNNLVFKP